MLSLKKQCQYSIAYFAPTERNFPQRYRERHSFALSHRGLKRQSRLVPAAHKQERLQVVFVTTEIAPWSKTGGLADVLSGLPAALAARGHRVMTVSPRYSDYLDTVDCGLRAPVSVPGHSTTQHSQKQDSSMQEAVVQQQNKNILQQENEGLGQQTMNGVAVSDMTDASEEANLEQHSILHTGAASHPLTSDHISVIVNTSHAKSALPQNYQSQQENLDSSSNKSQQLSNRESHSRNCTTQNGPSDAAYLQDLIQGHVKYYTTYTDDGVQHVFVDHPAFRNMAHAFSGDGGSSSYVYTYGEDSQEIQTRNSILCQAALAAPVLLWPEIQMGNLTRKEQQELRALQMFLSQHTSNAANRTLKVAKALTYGIARPAVQMSYGVQQQQPRTPLWSQRMSSGASKSASVLETAMSSSNDDHEHEQGNALPGFQQDDVTTSSDSTSAAAATRFEQQQNEFDDSTDSSYDEETPMSDQVIFVGNDWPTGLLGLWHQVGAMEISNIDTVFLQEFMNSVVASKLAGTDQLDLLGHNLTHHDHVEDVATGNDSMSNGAHCLVQEADDDCEASAHNDPESTSAAQAVPWPLTASEDGMSQSASEREVSHAQSKQLSVSPVHSNVPDDLHLHDDKELITEILTEDSLAGSDNANNDQVLITENRTEDSLAGSDDAISDKQGQDGDNSVAGTPAAEEHADMHVPDARTVFVSSEDGTGILQEITNGEEASAGEQQHQLHMQVEGMASATAVDRASTESLEEQSHAADNEASITGVPDETQHTAGVSDNVASADSAESTLTESLDASQVFAEWNELFPVVSSDLAGDEIKSWIQTPVQVAQEVTLREELATAFEPSDPGQVPVAGDLPTDSPLSKSLLDAHVESDSESQATVIDREAVTTEPNGSSVNASRTSISDDTQSSDVAPANQANSCGSDQERSQGNSGGFLHVMVRRFQQLVTKSLRKAQFVLTIHNFGYQGLFSSASYKNTGLPVNDPPEELLTVDKQEASGQAVGEPADSATATDASTSCTTAPPQPSSDISGVTSGAVKGVPPPDVQAPGLMDEQQAGEQQQEGECQRMSNDSSAVGSEATDSDTGCVQPTRQDCEGQAGSAAEQDTQEVQVQVGQQAAPATDQEQAGVGSSMARVMCASVISSSSSSSSCSDEDDYLLLHPQRGLKDAATSDNSAPNTKHIGADGDGSQEGDKFDQKQQQQQQAVAQGCISWLQAAVLTSDLLITVSGTHAQEILDQTLQFSPSSNASAASHTTSGEQDGSIPHDDDDRPKFAQADAGSVTSTPATNTPGNASGSAATRHTAKLLEGVARKGLVGIMNGINTDVWCPEKDPYLPRHVRYNRYNMYYKKAKAKALLQASLGLKVNPRAPLVAFVGRLEDQKGADVLLAALPQLLGPSSSAVKDPRTGTTARPTSGAEADAIHSHPIMMVEDVDDEENDTQTMKVPATASDDHLKDMQFVALGAGQPWLQSCIEQLSVGWPGRAAGNAGFNEPLAHLIMAAADFLIVPSRYEPCGLVALCAVRYGTLPIVSPVGGLLEAVDAATHVESSHASNNINITSDHKSSTRYQNVRNPAKDGMDVAGASKVLQTRLGFVMPTSVHNPSDSVQYRESVQGVVDTVRTAVQQYGNDTFLSMREACMAKDVSWNSAAEQWEVALTNLVLRQRAAEIADRMRKSASARAGIVASVDSTGDGVDVMGASPHNKDMEAINSRMTDDHAAHVSVSSATAGSDSLSDSSDGESTYLDSSSSAFTELEDMQVWSDFNDDGVDDVETDRENTPQEVVVHNTAG